MYYVIKVLNASKTYYSIIKAEYQALIIELQLARSLGIEKIKIYYDRWMVIGHVNDDYVMKRDRLAKYLELVNQLKEKFNNFKLVKVDRG